MKAATAQYRAASRERVTSGGLCTYLSDTIHELRTRVALPIRL